MNVASVNVFNLPKWTPKDYTTDNEFIRQLAEKTRKLRLHALKSAPEAFGSSYETEVKKGLEESIEKLKTPQADHFFATDNHIVPWTAETNNVFCRTLLAANLIGMVVLIGPLTSSGSLAISARGDPLSLYARAKTANAMAELHESTLEPLHYHFNGMFVDPEHQGVGIGKALFEAAIGKATREATSRSQELHCTVLVNAGNTSAYKLYEKMGFRATGEQTYVQQPRLQIGQLRSEERVAIKMEMTRRSST